MTHIHKKIRHHLTKNRSLIITFAGLFCVIIFLSGAFLLTKGNNPLLSELAFTEHSKVGIGSIIPASCESSPWMVANGDGNYTNCATVTCGDGSIITPAMGQTCPAQTPASCTANGPLSWGAGCSTYWSGTVASGQTATAYNSAAGYSGYQSYSCNNGSWGFIGESCTANPTPVNGTCSTMGANGNYPANGCNSGVLGSNAVQPNGDYHWYCNGTDGGSTSGLCWYSPPPVVNGTCSTMGPNGNTPANSCNTGTLGSNAVQPNGDYHWYCNGANGGSTSPLCYYVPPPTSCTNGATNPPTCTTCPAGYTWNGSSCVAPSLVYLYGTSCTIPLGGNDCNTRAQWSIANATDPRVYLDGNVGWAWFAATGDQYHNFGVVGPGNHTFSAYDGGTGTTFQTVAVSKSCATGSTWNGSTCAANACSNGATNPPSCTPPPDLTAGYTIPTSGNTGSPITLQAAIYNSPSGGPTPTSFYNFMQVATQPNGAGTIIDLAPVLMSALPSGGSLLTSQTYTFSTSGTYSIRTCADKSSASDGGTIIESNENNNCGAWTTITITGLSCSALPTQMWLTNCSAAVPGVNDKEYSVVTNAAGNDYTGSASWLCTNGTWSGPTNTSCTPPPPSSVTTFDISPRSVEPGGLIKITWSILNPPSPSDPTKQCKIVATVQKPAVCDATCLANRNAAQNALNSDLSTGTTNTNDPNGANRVMSTALNTKVGGTQYAKGQKSVNIDYSTTFTATCGTQFPPVNSIIYVTSRVEG